MLSTHTGFLACADLAPACFSLLSLFACNISQDSVFCLCRGTALEQVFSSLLEALCHFFTVLVWQTTRADNGKCNAA